MKSQAIEALGSHVKLIAEDSSDKRETESELWIGYLRGSDAALAEIYRLYSVTLFHYGRQFTKNDDLIYDTIQDVFIYMVDAREKLSVAKSVKYYLFSVFRRMLMRTLKKNKHVFHADQEELEGFLIKVNRDYHPVQGQLCEQQKKIILRAVNKLPARQREILGLRFFEGFSYEQIAVVMNLANAKTVRTTIYRLLNRLNKKLSPYKEYFYLICCIRWFF